MKVRSRAKTETAETAKPNAAMVAANSMLASIAYDERMRSGAPPDAVATDVAVPRLVLACGMATALGEPLRCREPRCRRTRRCVGPTMRCSRRDVAAPPSTPEKDAKLMEMYREALQARAGAGHRVSKSVLRSPDASHRFTRAMLLQPRRPRAGRRNARARRPAARARSR